MNENFWFYLVLGIAFVASNVITHIVTARNTGDEIDLLTLVNEAVLAAEQILPGKTGAEKYAFVISQVQKITGADDSQMAYVRLLIEAAVKRFKLSTIGGEVLTAGVTPAGQRLADAMALRDLR